MNTDPVIEEIHEARRKLWAECDGTLEGYSRHCEEAAREFRARVAAEVARKNAAGTWSPPFDHDGETPTWEHGEVVGVPMMVREGEAPEYGAKEGGEG